MPKKVEPLSYAIIRLFEDGETRCAADVVRELQPAYGGHKLLTEQDVDETLATAKENELLNVVRVELSNSGKVQIFFKISAYGLSMVERYL